MIPELPTATRIVIIGGGVIGTCLAWSLTRLGCSDVVLLEQGQLGCGTSWHSAGNIIRMNTDPVTVELFSRSHAIIEELDQRHALGWRPCGRLMLARGASRMREFERICDTLGRLGVDTEIVGADRVAGQLPVLRTDDIEGAIWSPGDGRLDPMALINAYAREARDAGARLFEGIGVERARVKDGRVAGVETAQGDIECDQLVNCAGLWARDLGLRNGVNIPLYPVEHFYLLSEIIEGVYPEMPTFRDPDGLIYGREEVGGLLLGCFDRNAIPIRVSELPQPFEFGLLNENWEQFEPYLEQGLHRVPALAESGIRALINGPESFTPDAEPHMDEAPGLTGYFVLAGLSSTGITRSGGMSEALANWLLNGDPGIDASRFSLRRFGHDFDDENRLRQRVSEVPAGHFTIES